jgi:excinuclease ABC subunit A
VSIAETAGGGDCAAALGEVRYAPPRAIGPRAHGSTMHPIRLRGARTNNLQSVDLDIEPGTLLVLCGPSGAGKSSLAFGTLYAEGQRRYVESFSAYARQFLERLARPPLDALSFMPAAIAVDRGGQVKTSRSTVATLTELSDYLKQLWALAAALDCPSCGAKVHAHSPQSAADALQAELPDRRVVVTYPLSVSSEEDFLSVRESLVEAGYRRLLVGTEVRDLDEVRPSDVLGEAPRPRKRAAVTRSPTQLYVVADRTTTRSADRARLVEALEAAFARGAGQTRIATPEGERVELSTDLRCDRCGQGFRKPSPGLFSFNSPIGACEQCHGFGRTIGVDWDKVFADRSKSLADGAIRPWAGAAAKHERRLLIRYCKRAQIPTDVPIRELTPEQLSSLIEGDGGGWRNGYPGLRRWFAWLETRAYKMHVRVMLARYRSYDPCSACGGLRFKPEVRGWKVAGVTLPELYASEVTQALAFVEARATEASQEPSLLRVVDECRARLATLRDVGLGYLTLDRSARSLSGGELQRVSLASALDSRLTGTLFVLDEPTAGLHPADVERLLPVVRRLTQGDNIAIVVESDERFLEGADRIVELGPGAGEAGGRIVLDADPVGLRGADTSTARWLRSRVGERRPRERAGQGELVLRGARGNNLRNVELRVPLGALTCITGVSGSGKSSLIVETLVPAVARALGEQAVAPLAFDELHGVEGLRRTVLVDQAALGRTSRGNPATYLGAWDALRRRLAATPLARERGYKPGAFSFNVAGGRCEGCKGEGSETVEMQFLADVRFSCPECGGKRFVGPILDVQLEGKNVADLLELTSAEALARFAACPDVVAAVKPLVEVGAGYLRLGQPLSSLSGGEAQRLKLAGALAEVDGGALIVLDEPTAGLHGSDVAPLLECLHRLVEAGNTVVVVEHDMRTAAEADHVIDLGPGAGEAGGCVVAAGTPAEVALRDGSVTAKYLRVALAPSGAADGSHRVALRSAESPGADAAAANVVRVRGAREHNLKGFDVDIPRDRLVVVTGPSGSGKSTLAFDIVFAESQRRYLETLSPYVRQYLKQLPQPEVDRVDGVPPSVSLEQRQTGGAKNSTVATVTEVAHHLRLLFARAGVLHCPTCAIEIAPRPLQALHTDLSKRFKRLPLRVLAPVIRAQKGAHRELLARAYAQGVQRARIDGNFRDLEPGMSLERYREHDIELLLGSEPASSAELRALLERALIATRGTARVLAGDQELMLSSERACAKCGTGYPELDPRFFSFNTRQGACARCEGKGYVEAETKRKGKKSKQAESAQRVVCPACAGQRLAGLALHVRVDGALITDLLALGVDAARERIEAISLSGRAQEIGLLPLREILARLKFLQRVGLGYLALDRAAWTLSGGEMQRVRLAGQLGSGLTGVLYVLDEPTIGLHPRDTGRLLSALRDLVGQGCSVLVVEHDADTIRSADHVIDVGPVGGHEGGHIVAQGPPELLLRNPASVTGASLARAVTLPAQRREVTAGPWLEVLGAREHNLDGVHLRVPAGRLTAVTGVSGSGKSTLVREVFLRAVRAALGLATEPPGAHERVRGTHLIKRAVEIDQSPIGRTPRSVPATYVGVWDEIRKLYAATPEARARGYDASRFSFNVKHGRCAVCEGQGALSVEMAFLPEAQLKCEGCGGLRYNPETLSVRLHDVSIGELLALHVDEVAKLLSAFPKVRRPLELMCELGLGYLELGQASNTLSGGEAQRLKLVAELSTSGAGPTLYVMDEPTTGLHREDVARLLGVLDRLVARGDTVLTIEHHPDVIAYADFVVDLGPEGGSGGGRIVAEGTPEQVARVQASHTGAVLRELLGSVPAGPPPGAATRRARRDPSSRGSARSSR